MDPACQKPGLRGCIGASIFLNVKLLNLKELYATLPKDNSSDVLASVLVETACGLLVKLVFVLMAHDSQHRSDDRCSGSRTNLQHEMEH